MVPRNVKRRRGFLTCYIRAEKGVGQPVQRALLLEEVERVLITQTPLRVSLAGGGTDLSSYYRARGGAVVSAAVDKFVYVILNQRFDEKIYISYSKKEIVDSVDEIQHELVREAMRMAGVQRGVEIAIMADVPADGSGLGSSSSLTVGLLNAFHQYRGVQLGPEQLAREACEIEIDICGKPIGKQDQYIAAYGGLHFFRWNQDDSVSAEALPIGKARQGIGSRLMLFYTDITRRADPILERQTSNASANQGHLDRIKDLAINVRERILAEDYDSIGESLRENWTLKCQLAEGVSTPAIEEMVSAAITGGALGCKISGAGGGGFLLTYCQREDKQALRRAMAPRRELPFFLERYGSKVVFNMESYEWK